MTNVLGVIVLAGMLGIIYFCIQGIRKKPHAVRGFLISAGVAFGAIALMPEPSQGVSASAPVATSPEPAATTPQEPAADAPASSTPWRYIVDEVQFGCASKDDFARIVSYAADGDREAYTQAITDGFTSGQCRPFQADQEVYVEGGNFLGGLVELRAKGETATWWTNIEATKPTR